MAVMFCLECHEALPLPSAGAAPTEIGCPRCGAVYPWPPRGVKAKPLEVRHDVPPRTTTQTLPAVLTVEPCPACARPLRLSVDRAGQLATCPRSDCGHTFTFQPQNVGQEVSSLEIHCSTYGQDYFYTALFQRPKGSSAQFTFQESQKGTGAIDRLAGGSNYDEITQSGTISYNRNLQAIDIDLYSKTNHACPWCTQSGIQICLECGTNYCASEPYGIREETCPGCGQSWIGSNKDRNHKLLSRLATYTPKQTRIAAKTPLAPAITNKQPEQDQGRYLPSAVGKLLRLGRKD